jgi:L-alanine-DL-glutamate epimerase-like enolase superfamily enzyme
MEAKYANLCDPPMRFTLNVETKIWPMREPFAISRGVMRETESVVVTLTDEAGNRGWGEGCGVDYAGETANTMLAQLEKIRPRVESGLSRGELSTLLAPGGARCALDCALWDLEAKGSDQSVFAIAGIASPARVNTAYTIGIRSNGARRVAAEAHASYAVLKIKVDDNDPVAAITAVRKGAPKPAFIVDPNQAWSVSMLKTVAPQLANLGVVLLEQPIKVGDEPGLDGYRCPVSIAADELINDARDLEKAKGRFDVINIKLDKAGGLTEGLRMAEIARSNGFELMVGCMIGSSLSMAPALVLAQSCRFVDLDGPLLLGADWPNGLTYTDGVIDLPDPKFWG